MRVRRSDFEALVNRANTGEAPAADTSQAQAF